jgi:hypothetical protein
MLGNYRVAAQLVVSLEMLSSTELVSQYVQKSENTVEKFK